MIETENRQKNIKKYSATLGGLLNNRSLCLMHKEMLTNFFDCAGVDFEALLNTYATTGFQATSFGKAAEEINKMVL